MVPNLSEYMFRVAASEVPTTPGVVSINNIYKMKAVGMLVAVHTKNKKELFDISAGETSGDNVLR